MLDYTGFLGLKWFYTLQEACEAWGMNKTELKAASEKYGFYPIKDKETGVFGFDKYNFHLINNLFYFEQCRDGEDDSQMWVTWFTEV